MFRGPKPVPATSTSADPHLDQLGEVVGGDLRELGEIDPALLGDRRCVDEVDRLLGVTGEDPDQDRDPEQARVVVGDPAVELDLDPVDGAVAESLGEPAELLAQGHERCQRLHLLRAHSGDVDRVRDHPARERGADLLGGDDPGAVLGLGGRGAEVRGDDDVVALEQRMIGERLLGEDVERRAGDLAGLEPGRKRIEVDELAAGAVDDPDPVAHLRDRVGSIQPTVSGVFGRWIVITSARR